MYLDLRTLLWVGDTRREQLTPIALPCGAISARPHPRGSKRAAETYGTSGLRRWRTPPRRQTSTIVLFPRRTSRSPPSRGASSASSPTPSRKVPAVGRRWGTWERRRDELNPFTTAKHIQENPKKILRKSQENPTKFLRKSQENPKKSCPQKYGCSSKGVSKAGPVHILHTMRYRCSARVATSGRPTQHCLQQAQSQHHKRASERAGSAGSLEQAGTAYFMTCSASTVYQRPSQPNPPQLRRHGGLLHSNSTR